MFFKFKKSDILLCIFLKNGSWKWHFINLPNVPFWNQVYGNMMSVFWWRYVPHNLMALSLTEDDLLLSKLAWYMLEAVKSRACWMRRDVLLKRVWYTNLLWNMGFGFFLFCFDWLAFANSLNSLASLLSGTQWVII